jgi:PAS domain-containing protein
MTPAALYAEQNKIQQSSYNVSKLLEDCIAEHGILGVSVASRKNITSLGALDLLPQLICFARFRRSEYQEFSNKAWRDYLNDADQDVSRLFWLYPEDRGHALKLQQQSLATKESFEIECRILSKSGEYRWFLVQALFSQDEDHQGLWQIYICTDIHKHKLRELDLERRANLQTDMLNVSVDCIKVIAPDGRLKHMNSAGCVALGVSEQSGFGCRLRSLGLRCG